MMITCAVTGAIHTPSMSPHLPIGRTRILLRAWLMRDVVERQGGTRQTRRLRPAKVRGFGRLGALPVEVEIRTGNRVGSDPLQGNVAVPKQGNRRSSDISILIQ